MMKKILIYALVLTVCLCGLWSLSGCDEEKAVIDVTLTVPEETPLFSIGEFDASLYSLTIRYLDGSERTIPLTEELIPDSEQPKFYTEGEQKIKVEYLGFPMEFSVAFGRYTFPEDIKLEAAPVTYDGQAHTVTMSGNIPAGTTVSYPLGNSFTGVGEHTVTAILSRENYVTKEFETTFEIKRGVYDLSNYSFVSDGFTYDGEEHQIEASGTLPLGVSVSYALYNEQKEKLPNPNYKTSTLTRTFTIRSVTVDALKVLSPNGDFTYMQKVYDGTLTMPCDAALETLKKSYGIETTVRVRYGTKTTGFIIPIPTDCGTYTVEFSFKGEDANVTSEDQTIFVRSRFICRIPLLPLPTSLTGRRSTCKWAWISRTSKA